MVAIAKYTLISKEEINMLIPSNHVIENGQSAPEGMVAVRCSTCQRQFAIPSEELKNFSLMKENLCEDCGKEADKAAVVESAVSLKSGDAAEVVKTALGD